MNKITQLFNIKYPIIQGGMIWNSGYKLASAVSNAGGLGLIGAGSMYPDVLREHIQKCKKATRQTFWCKHSNALSQCRRNYSNYY
jgi:enoyl-[acyl-carrier protein] reductase II